MQRREFTLVCQSARMVPHSREYREERVNVSRSQQLYELQLVDLEIDSKTENLARLEERLQTPHWLTEAQERVELLKSKVGDLERRQRDLEWTSDDLRAKVAELEEKLYGGRVRNPKELSGLQQEADAFKLKRSETEDALLELMLQLEALQEEIATASGERDRLDSQWRTEHQQLKTEHEKLTSELAALTARRDSLASRVPESDYRLYAGLKQERGGRAVVKVERNMCSGCRISMSSVEIQRARTSNEPIRCGSCGRVLYVA